MTEPDIIRCSYLPVYPDCPRRFAARVFKKYIEAWGFVLRKLTRNIAAAGGSATHKAVAHSLKEKVKTGELANLQEAEQAGLEYLANEVKYGVRWDEIAPNLNTAEKQMIRQHKSYRIHVAPKFQPTAIEQRLYGMHKATGFLLSGQQDAVVTTGEAEGRDLKTGKAVRANVGQYGGYVLLLKANGVPLLRFIEDYVPRVRLNKSQPEPSEIHYGIEQSARIAASILRRAKKDLDAFEATGDPLSFMANPNSMLCSERWCSAWGTRFCTEHKEK